MKKNNLKNQKEQRYIRTERVSYTFVYDNRNRHMKVQIPTCNSNKNCNRRTDKQMRIRIHKIIYKQLQTPIFDSRQRMIEQILIGHHEIKVK